VKVLLLTGTIAFRGATLIDGTGSAACSDSLLVVSGEKIVAIGTATAEAIRALPRGTEIRNVTGKWIVPGLIDAHVHAESDDDLKTMLRWGVTSVRLMAEDAAAAGKLEADSRTRADIPQVFPAAPIFTTRGGWWDQGQPPDRSLNRFPATPEEARRSVQRARDLGSREIKLMLDDMAWCRAPRPALPRMSPEIAKALIEEARSSGLRASVHAPNLADAKEAIAGGATALAHGVLEPIDEQTIEVMKQRPVFYIPTMDIFEFLADTHAFVDSVLADPIVTRRMVGLPEDLVARYRSPAYAEGYRQRYSNFENVKNHLAPLRQNLRALHKAGVPIALGTDMWAFPGLGVSIEMNLYVKSGISPLDAIRAATQTAARSLGIEGDRGTLQPGKRADFLILYADPIADVKNVRRILEIYKNGQKVGPTVTVTAYD